jgi:hypothetical protein
VVASVWGPALGMGIKTERHLCSRMLLLDGLTLPQQNLQEPRCGADGVDGRVGLVVLAAVDAPLGDADAWSIYCGLYIVYILWSRLRLSPGRRPPEQGAMAIPTSMISKRHNTTFYTSPT